MSGGCSLQRAGQSDWPNVPQGSPPMFHNICHLSPDSEPFLLESNTNGNWARNKPSENRNFINGDTCNDACAAKRFFPVKNQPKALTQTYNKLNIQRKFSIWFTAFDNPKKTGLKNVFVLWDLWLLSLMRFSFCFVFCKTNMYCGKAHFQIFYQCSHERYLMFSFSQSKRLFSQIVSWISLSQYPLTSEGFKQ